MRLPVGTEVSIVSGKYQHHTGVVTALLPVWVRVRLHPLPSSGLGRRTANQMVTLPDRQLRPKPTESIAATGEHRLNSMRYDSLSSTTIPPTFPGVVRTVDDDRETQLIADLAAMSICRHGSGSRRVGLATFIQLLNEQMTQTETVTNDPNVIRD